MNVYIENILKGAELKAENIPAAYTVDMLHDEVLFNSVVFSVASTEIEAEWDGADWYADSVAVLGSNWISGRLAVESQGELVFDEMIASRGKNTIIKLPCLFTVSRMMLELNAAAVEKLEVGILFAGCRTELPLFNTGFKHRLNVNSRAERTRYGVVYGSRKSSLRSFDVAFSGMDNSRRLEMEEYIDAVQYVRPHLVEPYETDEYPPVYAVLTDAGGFDREDGAFSWKSALSYMEAK